MTKKISGAEFPLAKIFSSDFDYSIPSYQRPYAWTEVQAGELFSDLADFFAKEKDDTYFQLAHGVSHHQLTIKEPHGSLTCSAFQKYFTRAAEAWLSAEATRS